MYSNFMFLDSIFLNYHTQTNTHRYTHKDSDDYSIVAFCKNATITYCKQLCHRQPQTLTANLVQNKLGNIYTMGYKMHRT